MEKLLLTTPSQQKFKNPAVELKPKKVSEWLDSLPLLNPTLSVRALTEALNALNEQNISDKDRLALLELFRGSVNNIFYYFESEQIRRLPVTSDERSKIKGEIQQLIVSLANGYKIVVKNSSREIKDPRSDAKTVMATHRAIEQIALSLLQTYRMYAPVALFSFLEMNQLYHYARINGFADVPVKTGIEEDDLQTIANLYKKITVVVLSDPFRLGDGEALSLFQLLDEFVGYCEIFEGRHCQSAVGRYVFAAGEDQPPRPCDKVQEDRTGVFYTLDTNPMTKVIISQLQSETMQEAVRDRSELRLLKTVCPQLEGLLVRKSARVNVRRMVKLVIGMEAILYSIDHAESMLQADLEADGGIQVTHEEDQKPVHTLETWMVINESIKGYLLSHEQKGTETIKVGDLVGIYLPDAGSKERSFSVAIIRWLKGQANNKVEMGAEIIPGQPLPIEVCKEEESCCRGVFFPELPALKIPPSIAVPAHTLSSGEVVTINAAGKTTAVKLMDCLMETTQIDQFSFAPPSDNE